MNNPPAFSTYFTSEHALSMTLRDYFAAKAMKEIMGQAYELEKEFHVDDDFSFPDTMCSITKEAYKWADAMIKAREA